MYSQNNEEKIILDYFGPEFKGVVLDIGANDGITLSNSRACIERGWNALLLEPSSKAYAKLIKLYGPDLSAICYNIGIGDKTGDVEFYSSGSHLGNGDTDLLSTAKESELKRWEGTDNKFEKTVVRLVTWSFFLEMINKSLHKFDLISIDVEGMDYDVLLQIDLSYVQCKMLIVETNSIEDKKYIDLVCGQGYTLYHKNHENLIFVKA